MYDIIDIIICMKTLYIHTYMCFKIMESNSTGTDCLLWQTYASGCKLGPFANCASSRCLHFCRPNLVLLFPLSILALI